jgi:hypothetical protein
MSKCVVDVDVPLEIDYTSIKKIAQCKVYFSKESITKIECFINGKKYTPISIYDDQLIIIKAKELFKAGKSKPYTDIDNNFIVPKHNYAIDLQQKTPSKPKPITNKIIRRTKNLENIKNYVLKRNGETTIRNISESLNINVKTVQDILNRLNYTKTRDRNYKGRGMRFFVSIPR